MRKTGIELPDVDQSIGTLSGGQRQCVAIARAIHFGARVLVLDEPTAALGVKQSGVVLKYVAAARDAGLGVIGTGMIGQDHIRRLTDIVPEASVVFVNW